MKISREQGTTMLLLDDRGRVTLHLPTVTNVPPRYLQEFLVLLALWEARDKQLMQRIEAKIRLPEKRRKG